MQVTHARIHTYRHTAIHKHVDLCMHANTHTHTHTHAHFPLFFFYFSRPHSYRTQNLTKLTKPVIRIRSSAAGVSLNFPSFCLCLSEIERHGKDTDGGMEEVLVSAEGSGEDTDGGTEEVPGCPMSAEGSGEDTDGGMEEVPGCPMSAAGSGEDGGSAGEQQQFPVPSPPLQSCPASVGDGEKEMFPSQRGFESHSEWSRL